MMRWRNGIPFAVQLTVAIAALITIVVIVVTALYVSREQSYLRHELQDQAQLTLSAIESTIANALYELETDSLESVMDALQRVQSGYFARIYDDEGRMVADSSQVKTLVFGLNPDPFGQELIQTAEQVVHWESQSLRIGKSIVVGRQILGAISLEISTVELQAQSTAASQQGLLIIGGSIVFGTAISLLISRAFNRPLQEIIGVTEKIIQGNRTHQVPVYGTRELQSLANAFNAMTSHLDQSIVQLEHRSRDLSLTNAKLEQTNKELAIARDQALTANRLKDEFLSTMSHEMRTPMNAIEGFTTIMLNRLGGSDFNEKTERYLVRIHENSKRMIQIINDFLDISRIEAGRLELVHQPFSPRHMAQRWQSEIGILAEKKGLEFEVTIDPALPQTIYGDEEAISKVTINLLSNAIKFTEEGKVSLTVKHSQQQWFIIVSDTGIGIPSHAREYIFEEFRQVDQSSRRKYGGTGLGLAIVQKYVRTMGGTVALQSELGHGSTFTITLPLQEKAEPAEVL